MYTMLLGTNAWGWTERELFTNLADYLSSTERSTRIHERKRFRLPGPMGLPLLRPIGSGFAYLVDDHTRAYWLMVCEDWADGSIGTMRRAAADGRCRLILKQQYRDSRYDSSLKAKLRPWTYTAMSPTRLQQLLPRFRNTKRTRAGLYWRGNNGHAQRGPILERLSGLGLLATGTDAISFDGYCLELCTHRVALALPGWGNLCHREIEAFGMGTPVLMPRLLNQLHNDLIPDYHYVSVDVEVGRDSHDEIAAAISRRYLEVADEPEFLARIARHAMAWYDENAAFPAALRLTVDLLGLPDTQGCPTQPGEAPTSARRPLVDADLRVT